MKRLGVLLIGGGGHCKSVIDVIEAENKFEIIGILDVKEKVGSEISGYKIIGTDNDIEEWNQRNISFLITLGHIKSPELRIKTYEKLRSINATLVSVCSPNSYVSRNSKVGEGTIIMHHAILNAGATVGVNCIINNKTLIEHDSQIGDHCHISTSAVVNGDCKISNGCFIGSNSVLVQGVEIGENCLIGAGTVVTKAITRNQKIVGNPGKSLL